MYIGISHKRGVVNRIRDPHILFTARTFGEFWWRKVCTNEEWRKDSQIELPKSCKGVAP